MRPKTCNLFIQLMWKLNKRLAYGLTRAVKPVCVLCFVFVSYKNKAQDTVSLRPVEVNAHKNSVAQIGKKTVQVDSLTKEQFKFNSIGDLLAYNSSVYIKNYGPGALSTTALRGANASQTSVMWNGFNLQNAMLGQADLSLMPAVLFENVSVEYGGGSSNWGSGAMGGSIHLDTKTTFGQGLQSAINLGTGSYGLLKTSANVLVSKKRFVSSSKFYMHSATNNYAYRDTVDKENPIKKQKNASYDFKGLLQEFKFLINPKQLLTFNVWLNSNSRRLPSYNYQSESKTYQEDKAIRFTGNWTYVQGNFRSVIKAAYFKDVINYDDSLLALYSKSKVSTAMIENENYVDWLKNQKLNFSFSYSRSGAVSDNYAGDKSLSRTSVILGNKSLLWKGKLNTYVSVRAEYFSVGTLPITGNASLEYKLTKNIGAKVNAARVYRQPTLNELYWLRGGNTQLKAEQGYTYEGEFNFQKQVKRFSVLVSLAAYSRNIENWISWIPGGGGYPEAVNVQKVWSRGTETSWKLNYKKNKFKAGFSFMTAYVLSTVLADKQENGNTLNKQLVYTPRYTVNGNFSVGYERAELVLYHQYCGYRFTTTDNTQWLNPYQVSSLRSNYTCEFKKVRVIGFAACNNIFNTNYTVLSGRPMPLRNFEIGLTLQTKNTN